MTCRLEVDRQPEKPAKAVLIDAVVPDQAPRPRTTRQDSRITQAMSIAETCSIIDNTIASLLRSATIVAERSNRTPDQIIPAPPTAAVAEPLPETSTTTPQPNENSEIVIETFKDETQMPDIMRVITKELSEPYSIYTYRYFIHNWPQLCLLARDITNNCNIGVIVCKLDTEPKWRRGYIAMLAVEESYRRRGIGRQLVHKAIEAMREIGCDEVMLETEVTNTKALALYEGLGFIRERRLYRYYLNGVDAFRLKLLFADCWPSEVPLTHYSGTEVDNRATEIV
uniref:N-alpha-acetyltransferase 30 n=1 Tax=Panagrellus redivivus TaxID=6233 RepID=A0A7E4V4C9_PANRE